MSEDSIFEMSEDSIHKSLDADSVDDPDWTGRESSPPISRSQASLFRDNTRRQICVNHEAEKQEREYIFNQCRQDMSQRAIAATTAPCPVSNYHKESTHILFMKMFLMKCNHFTRQYAYTSSTTKHVQPPNATTF